MFWEIAEDNGCTVVAIEGPVDFEDVDEFRRLVARHIALGGRVCLDLARCGHLCSMAVGTILGFRIESTLRGGELWISNACDPIKRLFGIVGGADMLFQKPTPTRST